MLCAVDSARTPDPRMAIRLDSVGVRFRIPVEQQTTLKEQMIAWMHGRAGMMELWALNNVSLEIGRGEVFGLLGHNGAGKSTLLKLITQVLRPTTGRVQVRGRIAPLQELGGGFHPELTGRENILLTGTLLGYTREDMESRIPSIVEFSGLERFIDSPVRTYSSGMWARLGFAIATDRRSDILLIDEAMGVGDEAFRLKCDRRMAELSSGGTTVLIVSHDLAMIERKCHRVAVLSRGELVMVGRPKDAIAVHKERLARG